MRDMWETIYKYVWLLFNKGVQRALRFDDTTAAWRHETRINDPLLHDRSGLFQDIPYEMRTKEDLSFGILLLPSRPTACQYE